MQGYIPYLKREARRFKMPDICPKCGLPMELCVCNVLDRETETKIRIYTKKAKFDK